MIILAVYIGLAVLLISIIPKNTPTPIIALVGLLFPSLVIMTCLFLVSIFTKESKKKVVMTPESPLRDFSDGEGVSGANGGLIIFLSALFSLLAFMTIGIIFFN
jgi:hypothetical protein